LHRNFLALSTPVSRPFLEFRARFPAFEGAPLSPLPSLGKEKPREGRTFAGRKWKT
jgi:hypothetical protein